MSDGSEKWYKNNKKVNTIWVIIVQGGTPTGEKICAVQEETVSERWEAGDKNISMVDTSHWYQDLLSHHGKRLTTLVAKCNGARTITLNRLII